MKLNTPRWWYSRDHRHAPMTRLILKPASWLWAGITARRIARAAPVDPGAPVISIGNLTVGGSGKTPIAREVLRLLTAKGVRAAALSRGYGGRLEGPLRVDLSAHTAAEVGDEPLMLAQATEAWIARDRVAGARAAVATGVEALVLDDAHQNPSLKKTVSLIVVDGETRNDEWPFGDGSVFPSGPMREPFAAGMARADGVIILMPTDADQVNSELVAAFGQIPVFIARLRPQTAPPPGPQVGFAGIAKPWKVERSLIAAGCDLRDFVPFADHAALTERDFALLKDRAELFGAGLVTTEKDWVRLPPAWRNQVVSWPVVARFEDEAALMAFLDERLKAPSPKM
ncbi:tetraacyldisaccharide 4'-kinase [Brevundimonas vesicularis]|uniref:tetraacyldisaccharide 4'-kinase n=1 Tax=Brevundimonas vesicularis TaxID=41276 RepID=UPI0038D46A34